MDANQQPLQSYGADYHENQLHQAQGHGSGLPHPKSIQYKRNLNQRYAPEMVEQASQQPGPEDGDDQLADGMLLSEIANGAQYFEEVTRNLNSQEMGQWQLDPNLGISPAERIHQQMGALSPASTGQSVESFHLARGQASEPGMLQAVPGPLQPSMSIRSEQQYRQSQSSRSPFHAQSSSQSPSNRSGKQPKQQLVYGQSTPELMEREQEQSRRSRHDSQFEGDVRDVIQNSAAENGFQHQKHEDAGRPPSITDARVESGAPAGQDQHVMVDRAPMMKPLVSQSSTPQISQQISHKRLVGVHQKSTEETAKVQDGQDTPLMHQSSYSIKSDVRPFKAQLSHNQSELNARMAMEHDGHSGTNSQSTLHVNISMQRQLPNPTNQTTSTIMQPAPADLNLSRPAIISQGTFGLEQMAVQQPTGQQASAGKQQNQLALNLPLNDEISHIEANTGPQKIDSGSQSAQRQGLEASTSRKYEHEDFDDGLGSQYCGGKYDAAFVGDHACLQQHRVAGGGNNQLVLSQSQQDTYSLSQQNANQMSWRQPNQSTGEIDGLNLTDENHHLEDGDSSGANDHVQHLRQQAQQQSFRPSSNSNRFADACGGDGQHVLVVGGRNQGSTQELGMPQLSTIGHQVDEESTFQRHSAEHHAQQIQEEQIAHSDSNLELGPQLSMSSSKIEQAEAQLQAEVEQIGLIYEQHKQIQNWQAQLRQQLTGSQENYQTSDNDTSSNGLPSGKHNNSTSIQQLAYQNLLLQQQAYQVSIGNTKQFMQNIKEGAANNVSGHNGSQGNATKLLSSITNAASQMQQKYPLMSQHEQDVNNLSSIDFELARTTENQSAKKSNSDPSNLPLQVQSASAGRPGTRNTNKSHTLMAPPSALGGDEHPTQEPNSFSINRFNDIQFNRDHSQKRARDQRSSLSYSISQMQGNNLQAQPGYPAGNDRQVAPSQPAIIDQWKMKCATLEQDNHILKERVIELSDQLERAQDVEQENQRLKRENSELREAIARMEQRDPRNGQGAAANEPAGLIYGAGQALNGSSSGVMLNKQANVSSNSQTQSKHLKNNSSSADADLSMQLNHQIFQMSNTMETLKRQKQMLEQALREESKENEVLKLKEKILKDSVEQKLLTEQPAFKAFIKGSFTRSGTGSANNSRQIQNGKSRGQSQGRTIEEERQSKTFSSEMVQSQLPAKSKGSRQDSLLENYLHYNVVMQENQDLKRQVAVLFETLEKERKSSSKVQSSASRTQQQLNHLKSQMQGNEGEYLAGVRALQDQLATKEEQLAQKDQENKFLQGKVQKYAAALDRAYDELRRAVGASDAFDNRTGVSSPHHEDTNKQEKQQMIADLQAYIENLKRQVTDANSDGQFVLLRTDAYDQRAAATTDGIIGQANQNLKLQKQIDELQLANGLLELTKKRLEDELDLLNKRHSMEVESMKTIIEQNKNYGAAQETKVRETIQKYQKELLDQKSQYEGQNLQNMDQIAGLQQKIAELEQRLFSVQFEKAQADEDLQENVGNLQNLELEKLKCRQLLDKQRQSQTHMQSLTKRLETFEKKHELNLQQTANLQSQNQWLKEEREKTHSEMQALKSDLKRQQSAREDAQQRLDVLEEKGRESSSQMTHEVQRLSKAKIELEERLGASQDQIKKLERQLTRYEDERAQLEKDIMTFELDCQNAQRAAKALEKELQDKQEEVLLREQQDARAKRTTAENETLRSELSIIKKELEYSTQKTKELQIRLRDAEEESRHLSKQKRDLEEQLQSAYCAKENQKESSIQQMKHLNQIKDEHARLQIENRDMRNVQVRQVQQIEELEAQVHHLEGVVNDQRTELALNLRKQNDMTFKYEEGTKYWDAIQATRQQSMDQVVRPFLKQLSHQVDISNILQESLFGIFKPEKESTSGLKESSVNRQQVQYYERQIRELKRRIQYFGEGSDAGDKSEGAHLRAFKKLLEYVQFLQDQLISKLMSCVLESRSMNILDQKRFDSNEQIMKTQEEKIEEYEQIIKDNEVLVQSLEKRFQSLQENQEHQKVEQASLRQRVRDQVAEIDNLRLQLNIVQNDPGQTLGLTATTAFETGSNAKSQSLKGLLHHSRSQQGIRQMSSTQPTNHYSWRPVPSAKVASIPLPPGTTGKSTAGYHKYSTKQQSRTEIDISAFQADDGKSETLFGRKLANDKSGFEPTQNRSVQLNFRSNDESDRTYKRMGSNKPKTSESGLSMTLPGYYSHSRSPGMLTRATDQKSKGATTLRAQLDNMMK